MYLDLFRYARSFHTQVEETLAVNRVDREEGMAGGQIMAETLHLMDGPGYLSFSQFLEAHSSLPVHLLCFTACCLR